MKKVKVQDIIKLIVSIAVCQLAGVVGSLFTAPAIPSWYAGLEKPFFTPPNWLFAPVWLSLYCLMGIALFLVWRKGARTKGYKAALFIFAAQLIVNTLWSIAFFGFQSPLAGLVVILVLWALILLTIVYFFRISLAAGWLLVPYIIWVSIALALNTSIFVLNA